jgi:hypothetical protein
MLYLLNIYPCFIYLTVNLYSFNFGEYHFSPPRERPSDTSHKTRRNLKLYKQLKCLNTNMVLVKNKPEPHVILGATILRYLSVQLLCNNVKTICRYDNVVIEAFRKWRHDNRLSTVRKVFFWKAIIWSKKPHRSIKLVAQTFMSGKDVF